MKGYLKSQHFSKKLDSEILLKRCKNKANFFTINFVEYQLNVNFIVFRKKPLHLFSKNFSRILVIYSQNNQKQLNFTNKYTHNYSLLYKIKKNFNSVSILIVFF